MERKAKKYKTTCWSHITLLEYGVAQLLNDGFELYGNPYISEDGLFCQAMVKYEDSVPEEYQDAYNNLRIEGIRRQQQQESFRLTRELELLEKQLSQLQKAYSFTLPSEALSLLLRIVGEMDVIERKLKELG